jgi:hypothetical protein
MMRRFRNVTPNILSENIKTRKMRWVGHVGSVNEKRNAYMFLLGNLKEGDCLEDVRVDWMLILKLSLKTRGYEDLRWIYLAQDSDKSRALFSMTMDLRHWHVRRISWLDKEAFCSTELDIVDLSGTVCLHFKKEFYHWFKKSQPNFTLKISYLSLCYVSIWNVLFYSLWFFLLSVRLKAVTLIMLVSSQYASK